MPTGFRTLVTVVLYLVAKAVPKLPVSPIFLCEGEAVPGGLCRGCGPSPAGGWSLPDAPRPAASNVCRYCGNTPVLSANKPLTRLALACAASLLCLFD